VITGSFDNGPLLGVATVAVAVVAVVGVVVAAD
jgi:hypothetical protein